MCKMQAMLQFLTERRCILYLSTPREQCFYQVTYVLRLESNFRHRCQPKLCGHLCSTNQGQQLWGRCAAQACPRWCVSAVFEYHVRFRKEESGKLLSKLFFGGGDGCIATGRMEHVVARLQAGLLFTPQLSSPRSRGSRTWT